MMKKYFILIFGLLLLSFVNASAIPANNVQTVFDSTVTTPQIAPYVSSEEREESWSEKQICRFTKGCLTEDYCYPFGYIQDEQYCGIYISKHGSKSIKFVNQSKTGENCTQDFQCKSNFCFNKKCVNSIESLIVNLNSKITNLESKIKEENKKEITENISKEREVAEEQLPILENSKKEIGFFERIFGWNKK